MSKVRVLIVDDSVVYRSQIRAAIENCPEFEVVGVAANGDIALERLKAGDVDVMTLDLEMPVRNGLETLKELKKTTNGKPKVVIFSSQSYAGAKSTMEALSLGACDFVAKPTAESSSLSGSALIAQQLVPILKNLKFENTMIENTTPKPLQIRSKKKNWSQFYPKAIVIASSTGGPSALEVLFSSLSGSLRVPILIAQHMPPVFTRALAERLARVSGLNVHEAIDGEPILAGSVYVAPGDYHMKVVGNPARISLNQNPKIHYVRPAADELFNSASDVWKQNCLGVVLTGMGEDGARGAENIMKNGGSVVIQDEASCVVFGMPGAVARRDAYDQMLSIQELAINLSSLVTVKGCA
ncbi:MAG: chemotaxis-specific protein-glutamate methyltransferase CheB [Bacteriovoracaceae bacterium]|nr:chemotaxis-specific protein-glutamate methyltransferase CheB [Bacteriovoracaceae bacterium]